MSKSGSDDNFQKVLYDNLELSDALVIINFAKEKYASGLMKNWLNKHPNKPAMIINGDDFLTQDNLKLDIQASGNTKIYILSHSLPGSDVLIADREPNDNRDKNISCVRVATNLAQVIGNQSVSVNLIACGAARGVNESPNTNTFESVAAKLHVCLKTLLKRDIPIIARTQVMIMNPSDGHKFTTPLEKDFGISKREHYRNKQYGSKIILTTDDNNTQVKLDAYKHKWKIDLIKDLNAIYSECRQPPEKIKLLEKWRSSFKEKSADEIAAEVNAELKNPSSVLRRIKVAMSYFISKDLRHLEVIRSRMNEWNKINQSKFSLQGIQPTGLIQTNFEEILGRNINDITLIKMLRGMNKADILKFNVLLTSDSKEGRNIRQLVIQVLPKEVDAHKIGLQYLFELPQAISKLYTAIANNNEEKQLFFEALTKALQLELYRQLYGVGQLARQDPKGLLKLIYSAISDNNHRFLHAVANGLINLSSSSKMSRLIDLLEQTPVIVSPLIEALFSIDDNEHKYLNYFLDYLITKNANGMSGWQMIYIHEESSPEKILNIVLNKLETLDNNQLEKIINKLEKAAANTKDNNSPIDITSLLLEKVHSIQNYKAHSKPGRS